MARILARRRSRRWSHSCGPCTRRMKCPRAIRLSRANPAPDKYILLNESDSGDDIQILAAGLRNTGHSAGDMRALRARLEAIAPAPAARVRGSASRIVSACDRGDPARRRLAARLIRGSAFDRAYDSASAAIDGCPAPASVRGALSADLARSAGASVETRGGAVSRFSRIAVVRPQADPSAGLLARVYDHQSDVAHAGVL